MQFQAEWEDIKFNTWYPFIDKSVSFSYPGFKTNSIFDLTMTWTQEENIYVKSVSYDRIEFKISDNSIIAYVEKPQTSTLHTIKEVGSNEVIGYISIGEWEVPVGAAYEMSLQVIPSRISIYNHISTINGWTGTIRFKEGYNLNIETSPHTELNATAVEFIPEKNGGMGPYCGEPIYDDAIYNINSVGPDLQGNLQWTRGGFFILNSKPLENKVEFSLAIPANQQNCYRNGFVGPDGWTGPDGRDGLNGRDAKEINLEFEEC